MVPAFRVLIADPLADEGLAVLRADPAFEPVLKTGLSEDDLAELVPQFDAVVVRSGARITERVLSSQGRLKIVSRAGVGVDNIDLAAATRAGVLVINTPDANTLSTAEHTLALILSAARRVPAAHQHVARGGWERARFHGVQLSGKTLAILGFGRIGRAVASRALALEMNVVAFDPLVGERNPLGGRVRMAADKLDALRNADFVTLHAALTDQTRQMIDAPALAAMKKTAILVNCARGELVDESALAAALRDGRLAAAALDVFAKEPPIDNPLVGLSNVIHTPHLGASTTEAQLAVSIDAVRGVMDFLKEGRIRGAVNVVGLPHDLSPRELAFVDLADRIGRLLTPFCRAGVRSVRVTARGASLRRLALWLGEHVLLRVIGAHLAEPVSVVNVLEISRQRGIEFEAGADAAAGRESLRAAVDTTLGAHSIEGALTEHGRPRVRDFDGYALDMSPEGHMVLLRNDDRPGVIGLAATALGDAGVNIADMAVSRRGADALMVFRIDAPMPPEVVRSLRTRTPPIRAVDVVELPELPAPRDLEG